MKSSPQYIITKLSKSKTLKKNLKICIRKKEEYKLLIRNYTNWKTKGWYFLNAERKKRTFNLDFRI